MSEQTASSLYRQQCMQSKLPVDAKPDDKHKTKFCLLCDTQYCSANDNAKNNWGDAAIMNYNDVKFFCTIFDLPDVHTRDKLPLCPICIGLISKLIGYREQVQQTQALFDGLHLQLTTRAIKTCRKYNYNDVRPVNTTVQHIRRNVYRRWNREIGDTSGPTKAFNEAPPKLEAQKPENRRKSRLTPRTTIGSAIFHRPAPQLPPANFSPGISSQLPVLQPRPNPDPPLFKATIRHNISANVNLNPPHLEEIQNRNKIPELDPVVDTEMLANGNDTDSNFQLDDIAIIEVQGAAVPKEINYIDVDDDGSPEDSPVDKPDLPENEKSEKQEDGNENKVDKNGNENENTNEIDNQDNSIETPGTPKIIKICHSIFEDNSEDVNLNLSNLLSVKLEESDSEAEENPTQNPTASGTDEHEENGNGSQSPKRERPRRKCSVPVVISPRVGARKRKPTLRAVESSETMHMISKRRRKTSETGSTPSGSGSTPSGTEIPTSSFSSNEKKTAPDPIPEPEIEFDPEEPEREALENETDKPTVTSGAAPTMIMKDGVQQFSCEHCDKIFKSKERYKEHSDMHAGQAPVCKICNKTFPRKYNLNIHMRTHTGEKPHECRVCGQAYADKSNLNAHLRKHVDKPWNCLLCRKMYEQKAQALKHAEIIHPEESCDEIITTQNFYADYSDCGD